MLSLSVFLYGPSAAGQPAHRQRIAAIRSRVTGSSTSKRPSAMGERPERLVTAAVKRVLYFPCHSNTPPPRSATGQGPAGNGWTEFGSCCPLNNTESRLKSPPTAIRTLYTAFRTLDENFPTYCAIIILHKYVEPKNIS